MKNVHCSKLVCGIEIGVCVHVSAIERDRERLRRERERLSRERERLRRVKASERLRKEREIKMFPSVLTHCCGV